MFEIFADWHNFVHANKSFTSITVFVALQLNDESSHSQVKIAKFNTCKMIIIPKCTCKQECIISEREYPTPYTTV